MIKWSIMAVLGLFLVNCSAFKLPKKIENSVTNMGASCRLQQHHNRAYILGASEYQNIAADLFPNQNHDNLKTLTSALPVVPDWSDGNLELKPHAGLITDRIPIAEYFAAQFAALTSRECGSYSRSCRVEMLKQNLEKIYRRPAPENEIERLVSDNMDLDFPNFARVVFLAPDFHIKSYSQNLTPYELTVKISMTLFGSFPSKYLLDRKDQIFENPNILKNALKNQLSDGKNSRRFIERFWTKWLAVDGLENMSIPAKYNVNKSAIMEDFNRSIELAIQNDKSLSELFYSRPQNRVPASLITHPAFTLASSKVVQDELKSNYVHRGVNLASSLLCLQFPDLDPATVEEIEEKRDLASGLSISDTIDFHRSNPSCASCHSIIDPIGVTMEHLTPFGSFKQSFSDGSEIVSKGNFLNKNYHDLNSFVSLVSESDELKSCFVGNLRSLADGPDSKDLKECDAHEVFEDNPDQSILEALAGVFSANKFKKRGLAMEQFKWKLRDEVITGMYQNALDRQGSDQEIRNWSLRAFEEGIGPVIQGILMSQERRTRGFSQEELVIRFYRSLADREPTEEIQRKGLAALINQGEQALLSYLLNLAEVKNRLIVLAEGSGSE